MPGRDTQGKADAAARAKAEKARKAVTAAEARRLERDRDLQRWWKEGLSRHEIGAALGISAEGVRTRVRRLRERGWDVPPRAGEDVGRGGWQQSGTPHDAELMALWLKQRPIPEIAARLGQSMDWVRNRISRLRELGHDLPKRPLGGNGPARCAPPAHLDPDLADAPDGVVDAWPQPVTLWRGGRPVRTWPDVASFVRDGVERARWQGGVAVRQGASRHALRDRGDDLYETPAVCVRAAHRAGVFAAVAGSGPIWEPCAGRGAISRELRALGFSVVAQDLVAHDGADPDIISHRDFLMERSAPAGCRAIITNPPFKLADAFVRHGLQLGLDVIVLLRAMAIEGAGRADLIDRHLWAYWPGIDRPPAMHREGWQGARLSNSGAPFAWFHFRPCPRAPGQPIAMTRLWWDEGKAGGRTGGDAPGSLGGGAR